MGVLSQLNGACAAMRDAILGTRLNKIMQTMLYHCVTAPGLTIGTTSAAKIKAANTTTYVHNGVILTKTTFEVAFTATTHDIPANASTVQEAVYLVELAANGDPSIKMGKIATGAGNAVVPTPSSDKTPIGYLRLAVAAGATPFDASTDLLSAAHLTDTYVDLGVVDPSGYLSQVS